MKDIWDGDRRRTIFILPLRPSSKPRPEPLQCPQNTSEAYRLCKDPVAARARWVAINEARANGKSVKDLAAEYNICSKRVRDLLNKKTWGYDKPFGMAARTHCTHGHLFSEENIYRAPGNPYQRHCRQCMQNRSDRNKKLKRMNITVTQ